MSSLFAVSLVAAFLAAALVVIACILAIQISTQPVKKGLEIEKEMVEGLERMKYADEMEKSHFANPDFRTIEMSDVSKASTAGKTWVCGNLKGAKTAFILGSCRIIPFANFLVNHPFFKDCRVHLALVYLFDARALQDKQLLSDFLPLNVDYFFHEFLKSYGFLNTDVTQSANIFQLDFFRPGGKSVMLPNMPNPLLRLREMVKHDPIMKEAYDVYTRAVKRCGCNFNLSCACGQELKDAMVRCRDAHAERWAAILDKTQLFETARIVRSALENKHLFNTLNHPSNYFSLLVFTEVLRVHFPQIKRPCPPSVVAVSKKPEFTNHNEETTPWTVYDRVFLNYQWLAGVGNLAREI
jgi:hypothetical protein